ncbi:MAG TPA: ATP-binding protein [Xanthobacteraceae bacterium]|nr:ATP-binding protein [Xanthobacteraceae bacterium]
MAGIAQIVRNASPGHLAADAASMAVDACPNAMVLTDSAGRIVLVNTETERLFGYPREELIGNTIEALLPERLREGHVRARREFTLSPAPRRVGADQNLLGQHRDGREFPIEIGLYPIQRGRNAMVLSVIVDNAEGERTDRLKDEFVSTVSHELRTPLTSIAGSLGLLIGGAAGPLPEPALRLIRIAQNNSQRLVRLINDILDIEKIESGQIVFNFKRLSARALAEQVIDANRGYADGFHVRVRLDEAAAAGEVYADPDRLSQVIVNLLSNAIKFSPPDGEVDVAIKEDRASVRVGIRDRGNGIPKEFRPRIFEKFAQADATDARKKGGTGLGLSIVKQIVTRLGGTVGFADAPGGGTVFFFDLPAWEQVAACKTDTENGMHAARILLCENDPDAALALRESLRPVGFITDFAYSAADAFAQLQNGRYDAIVVDTDALDGGIGLVRDLRAQPATYKIPIVALSAGGGSEQYGQDCARTDGAQTNLTEWMHKPVDADRLAQILDRAILHRGDSRPSILHVDDDRDMLEIVAQTLDSTASIISVDSIESARYALLTHNFDLAILDIGLGAVSGLDLLPDLRRKDAPIPVIIFSALAGNLKDNPQIRANLNKASAASLRDLVSAVHDRLILQSAQVAQETG